MAEYDFKSLSDYDFELLVRDLLQKVFRTYLESFRRGRDSGIDLRYSRDPAGHSIIQCKHYAGSSTSKLLNHLQRAEAPKVQLLAPNRYVLATSSPLTPDNKNRIVEIFQPFIRTPQDIFGAGELNALLREFPDVERNNFKLYLTSATQLHAIINRGILSRTRTTLEQIQKRSRLYARTESFNSALKKLDEHSICIIAGIPGIGKTTLAEMILLRLAREGFEPIILSSDIEEAFSLLAPNSRQAFLYDDFLGQTSFEEKLAKNEDARLVGFLNTCHRNPNKRFLLTTREYILRQARASYERLATSALIDTAKLVVELEDYDRGNKSLILYNHIFYSETPRPLVQALVDSAAHRKLIDHPNYSPRLVESALEQARREESTGQTFVRDLLDTFDNPRRLWQHPFERHLRSQEQLLVLLMATLPSKVRLADLQRALLSDSPPSLEFSRTFHQSLQTLEDSFLSLDRIESESVAGLKNPSILDFGLNYLATHPDWTREIVNKHIVCFDQVEAIWTQASARGANGSHRYPGLSKLLSESGSRFLDLSKALLHAPAVAVFLGRDGGVRPTQQHVSYRLRQCLDIFNGLQVPQPDPWIKREILRVLSEPRAQLEGVDIKLVQEATALDVFRNDPGGLSEVVENIKASALSDIHSMQDFELWEQFEIAFPDHIANEDRQTADRAFDAAVDAEIQYILHDTDSSSEAESAITELSSALERRGSDLNYEVARELEARVDGLKELEESRRERYADDEVAGTFGETSDSEIDSMFEGLLDRDT